MKKLQPNYLPLAITVLICLAKFKFADGCDTDSDCKVNEYCSSDVCRPCVNCRVFNREPKVNCSKDVFIDCGKCLHGYEEVTAAVNTNESYLLNNCVLKSNNESLIIDDEKPYSISGWRVVGYGLLGALVGFLLGGAATVGMAAYYNKRKRGKERRDSMSKGKSHSNERGKFEISAISKPANRGLVNSVNEESGLLIDSSEEYRKHPKTDKGHSIKGCSTFKPLVGAYR